MSMTLPVRVYGVYGGTSVDDVARRLLVSCLREEDAQRVVLQLEGLKKVGALVPGDAALEFFQIAADVDLDIAAASVEAAIAQGYAVRSVVLSSADIPKGKVLANITGTVVEPGDVVAAAAVLPDPAGAIL